MRCSQPEGHPNFSLSALWKASFKKGKEWNAHRPELQHCSNFMWKHKEYQGLRALSHQILGSGLQEALPSDLVIPLSIDKGGCLAAEWSLYLPPFLWSEVLSRLPQRSLPGWAPQYPCILSSGRALIPSTVQLLFLLLTKGAGSWRSVG